MNLNPLHIKGLIELVNNSPYFKHSAMTLEDMGPGFAEVKVEIGSDHLSPYGAIQGGVYAAVVDTATYWASYAELAEDAGLVTIDVNVNYVGSVSKGHLVVRGERIKVGKSLCVAEATIWDDHGKILAHGTSKLLVTKGLQAISQITGYSEDKVPAKFI